MKKKNIILPVVLAACLTASLAACGGSSPKETAAKETEAQTEAAETEAMETEAPETEAAPETEGSEDGQNPVMNFIGYYISDRATVFVEPADGDHGASVLVTWGSSAFESTFWEMTGTFDSDALTIEYSDCVKSNIVYDEEGNIESQDDEYTDGHGAITFSDGSPITLTWEDDEENIADGMVFEYSNIAVGPDLANPWHDADSLEAAAAGAGLDSFSFEEGMVLSIGEIFDKSYGYMEGIAEADYEFPAVSMVIRKGNASAAMEEGDISGDYNDYAYSWTQNIKGLEVNCFGNRENESAKTIWTVEDTCYSINVYGLGGDTDFGLSPDDINSVINGLQ